MLQESEITRKAQTPTGTKWYRDQETRDIVDGHTNSIAAISNDVGDIKTALNYPSGTITWFGWKKVINDSNCEGEPCGNLLRLARMQSILQLGGYMVKNNHTRRKLSPNNHHFYADDGSAVVFTGADGHYQWGWGVDMYYGTWVEDGYRYEVFDDRPIPGHPCVKIPVGSVSASGRCAIDRTNLQLVGYLSDDARYRGGNNTSEWDNTYRSLLGMAVSNIPITSLAGYARKNGNLWMANERVAIFIVGALMRVFFHNSNIQASFIEGVDERGLHRGGLGYGIDYNDSQMEWSGNRGYNPYIRMDVGLDMGDRTGLFKTTIKRSDDSDLVVNNMPCFMGLKNWYRYMWVMEEDSLLVCNSNKSQSYYVKRVIDGEAPSLSSVSDKVLAGTCPSHGSGSWSAIKKLGYEYLSGYPVEDGATYDTFVGDGYYNPAVSDGSVRGARRLGVVYYGDNAGSCMLHGSVAPSDADAYWGAVLCEFETSFDTQLSVPSE